MRKPVTLTTEERTEAALKNFTAWTRYTLAKTKRETEEKYPKMFPQSKSADS